MLTAGTLARKTDLPVHTVRRYTRIGLLRPSRNSQNNYKVYAKGGKNDCGKFDKNRIH